MKKVFVFVKDGCVISLLMDPDVVVYVIDQDIQSEDDAKKCISVYEDNEEKITLENIRKNISNKWAYNINEELIKGILKR